MFLCSTHTHTHTHYSYWYPLVGTAGSALATHGIVIVCLQLLQLLLCLLLLLWLLLFLCCCVLYCVVFIRRNVRGEFVCFMAALNLMPHKVIA